MNVDKTHDWRLETQGTLVRLVLGGSFDFNAYRAFKQLSDQALATHAAQEYEVDLSALGYLDSSALGMLLNFQDAASAAGRTVALSGAKGMVQQILAIANFQQIFTFR